MRLLAVRGPTDLSHPGALTDKVRGQLLDELNELEQLADRVRSEARSSRTGDRPASCESFFAKLNPNAPDAVWLLARDWYERVRELIAHDRAFLGRHAGEAGSTSAQPPDLKTGVSSRVSFRLPHPLALGEAANVLNPRRAERWQELDDGGSNGGWPRFAEILLEELFERDPPPGWRLARVMVEDFRGGSVRDRVAGYDWNDGRGLAVVLVAPGDGGTGGLRAQIGLLPAIGKLDARAVWKHLTSPTPAGDPPFVRNALLLLTHLSRQPRRRPWEEVRQNVLKPGSADPRLLAELASHADRVVAESGSNKAAIRNALPTLMTATPWDDVRRQIRRAATPLADSPGALNGIFQTAVERCPAECSDSDLDFLLAAAATFGVNLGQTRCVISAFESFGQKHPLPRATRANFRTLLGTNLTIDEQAVAALLQTLTEYLSAARLEKLADLLDDLRELLLSLLPIAAKAVREYVRGTVAPILAGWCPSPDPGVWLTADQQADFLRSFSAFVQLVTPLGPEWDVGVLSRWEAILPRVSGEVRPSRYPSSYWHLLRGWLLRATGDVRQVQTAAFRRDIAGWLVRYELERPTSERAVVTSGHLAALGAADVAHTVVAAVIEYTHDPALRCPAAEVLLALAGEPDEPLRSVVRELFRLHTWDRNAGPALRNWLAHAIEFPRAVRWNEFAYTGARALVGAESGTDIDGWSALLSQTHLPGASNQEWDAVLAESEALAEAPNGTALWGEKLAALALVRESRGTKCDLYQRCRAWIDDLLKAAISGITDDSGPLSSTRRLRLLAACLRENRETARERLGLLWPHVPVALLSLTNLALFAEFIELSRDAGVLGTPDLLHRLSAATLDWLERPGAGATDWRRLDAVAPLLGRAVVDVWGEVVRLAAAEELDNATALRLAEALYCSREHSRLAVFRDVLWQQAARLREADPAQAVRLLAVLGV